VVTSPRTAFRRRSRSGRPNSNWRSWRIRWRIRPSHRPSDPAGTALVTTFGRAVRW